MARLIYLRWFANELNVEYSKMNVIFDILKCIVLHI